jgi:hypothetical protein
VSTGVASWAGPGKAAPTDRHLYDLKSGWIPPGKGADINGTQAVFGSGFPGPSSSGGGFHILHSPKGIHAPIGALNFTPAQKDPTSGKMLGAQMHIPGVAAPAHLHNVSLIPGAGTHASGVPSLPSSRAFSPPVISHPAIPVGARTMAPQSAAGASPMAPPVGGGGDGAVGRGAEGDPGSDPLADGTTDPPITPDDGSGDSGNPLLDTIGSLWRNLQGAGQQQPAAAAAAPAADPTAGLPAISTDPIPKYGVDGKLIGYSIPNGVGGFTFESAKTAAPTTPTPKALQWHTNKNGTETATDAETGAVVAQKDRNGNITPVGGNSNAAQGSGGSPIQRFANAVAAQLGQAWGATALAQAREETANGTQFSAANNFANWGGVPDSQGNLRPGYATPEAGAQGYVDFLKNNSRYKNVLTAAQNGASPEEIADGLAAAGWAEDPNYAGKLRNLLGAPPPDGGFPQGGGPVGTSGGGTNGTAPPGYQWVTNPTTQDTTLVPDGKYTGTIITDPSTGDTYRQNTTTGALIPLFKGAVKTGSISAGQTTGTFDRTTGAFTPGYTAPNTTPSDFALGRSEYRFDPVSGQTTTLATKTDPWESGGDLYMPSGANWVANYPSNNKYAPAGGSLQGSGVGQPVSDVVQSTAPMTLPQNRTTMGANQPAPAATASAPQDPNTHADQEVDDTVTDPGTGGDDPWLVGTGANKAMPKHATHTTAPKPARAPGATMRPLRQAMGLAGGASTMPNPIPPTTPSPMPSIASTDPLNAAPPPPMPAPGAGGDAWVGAGADQSGYGNFGFTDNTQGGSANDPGAPDYSPWGGKGLGFGADSSADAWVSPLHDNDIVGVGNRFHEQVPGEGDHKGFDLQAYQGKAIRSPIHGTAQMDDHPDGLGHIIIIQGDNGWKHHLGHVQDAVVSPGARVRAGQLVGHVGSTGKGSSGPHLDYRIQDHTGNWVDPTPYFPLLVQQMGEAPGTIQPGGKVGTGDDSEDGGGDPGASDPGQSDPGQSDPGYSDPGTTDTSAPDLSNVPDYVGQSFDNGTPDASVNTGYNVGDTAASNPGPDWSAGWNTYAPSPDTSSADASSAPTGDPSWAGGDKSVQDTFNAYADSIGYPGGGSALWDANNAGQPSAQQGVALGEIGARLNQLGTNVTTLDNYGNPVTTDPTGSNQQVNGQSTSLGANVLSGLSDWWSNGLPQVGAPDAAPTTAPPDTSQQAIAFNGDPLNNPNLAGTNVQNPTAVEDDAQAQANAAQQAKDQQKQQQDWEAWMSANQDAAAGQGRGITGQGTPAAATLAPGELTAAANMVDPWTGQQNLGPAATSVAPQGWSGQSPTNLGPAATGTAPQEWSGFSGTPSIPSTTLAQQGPPAAAPAASAQAPAGRTNAPQAPQAGAPSPNSVTLTPAQLAAAVAPTPAPAAPATPPATPPVTPPVAPKTPPVTPPKTTVPPPGQVAITPYQAAILAQNDAKLKAQIDQANAQTNLELAKLSQTQQQYLLSSALKNPWLASLGSMQPGWNDPGGPNAAAVQGGLDPHNIPSPDAMAAASPFAKAAWMTARIINTGKPYETVLNELRQTYGSQFNFTAYPDPTRLEAAQMNPQDIANQGMLGDIGGQTSPEMWAAAGKQWAPSTTSSTNMGW